jgi:hypothetical protein
MTSRSKDAYVVFAALAATVALLSMSWNGIDTRVYWRAGRMLLAGDWAEVYQIHHLTPFKYHPFFAMLCAPLGAVKVGMAIKLWAIVNAVAMYDSLRRWHRHWDLGWPEIVLALLCLGHALWWHCRLGNVTLAMLWLWTVALTSPRAWVQGLCYALLIALKPWWVALVVPWVLLRRKELVAPITATLAAVSLAPLALGWEAFLTSYQRWWATFADPMHDRNFPKVDNQNWYGWLFRDRTLDGDERLLWWLAGSAAVGLVWLALWRGAARRRVPVSTPAASTPAASAPDPTAPDPPAPDPLIPDPAAWRLELSIMPLVLWTAPLSWIHHQLLLWPLLALAVGEARRHWDARLVLALCAIVLTVLSEPLVGRAIAYPALRAGWPLVGLVALEVWAGSRLAPRRDGGQWR